MIKFVLLFLTFIMLVGCGSSSSGEVVEEEALPEPHGKSSIPMLVLLVSYNDIKVSSSESVWGAKLFGKNQHELNHYYIEVSNSNFEFSRAAENDGVADDGIVSVELDKNHPDTDINSVDFAANVYPDLKAALVAVDAEVDFSNYDGDANGYISPDELLLTFIIAGYEDAYAGYHVSKGIWAHQYCMTSAANVPVLDGVGLMDCYNEGNFALFGERHDNTPSRTHDATIGIIAHELGHSAFSLPDLYNTSASTGGIGYFGLMGAGTWSIQNSSEYYGNTPTHFSAWSKLYNGWITPVEGQGYLSLFETSSADYNVLKIPIDSSSYYLLENRNNSGYDKGLYSLTGDFNGGMALWHINESKLTNYYIASNTVNADTNNKGVDLVEAVYGTIDSDGSGGDESALFYYGNVDSFETLVSDVSARGSQMTLNIN
ncbi:M6 family metalloprotease domain-containing protein [bacterium]|nr:M6 family metalloprotease domain-containing protein [bacterium]MBU1989693.1 M6 family metalloprotease domain-containing protein [bacterium]